MQITSLQKVEGCLEGTNVRDVFFDDEITVEFARELGKSGKLILKDKINKPFFKIIFRGKFTVKGSLGNDNIRAILPEGSGDNLVPELRETIEKSL
jgi:hypothetical protein